MVADLINLNKARKARSKAEAKTTAAQNRALHGATKSERENLKAEKTRKERLLDGARREDRDR